jgi:hypothetical protein
VPRNPRPADRSGCDAINCSGIARCGEQMRPHPHAPEPDEEEQEPIGRLTRVCHHPAAEYGAKLPVASCHSGTAPWVTARDRGRAHQCTTAKPINALRESNPRRPDATAAAKRSRSRSSRPRGSTR